MTVQYIIHFGIVDDIVLAYNGPYDEWLIGRVLWQRLTGFA